MKGRMIKMGLNLNKIGNSFYLTNWDQAGLGNYISANLYLTGPENHTHTLMEFRIYDPNVITGMREINIRVNDLMGSAPVKREIIENDVELAKEECKRLAADWLRELAEELYPAPEY